MPPEVLKKNFKVGCDGCPMRACGSCPFKTAGSDGSSLGASSPIKETIKKIVKSDLFSKNHIIFFRSTGTEVVRPVSSEKRCSECGTTSKNCPHNQLIK